MEKAFEFFSKKRYYIFYADGSWRTCEEGLWKEEQIWKTKPVASFWAGGELEVKAMQAVIERFTNV